MNGQFTAPKSPQSPDYEVQIAEGEIKLEPLDLQDIYSQTETAKSRKARSDKVVFELDIETKLVQWLADQPKLWSKEPEYINVTNKDRMQIWDEKSQDFPGRTGRDLSQWYKNLRNQYGKYTDLPPDMASRLTPRQKWITENCAFLKTSIRRISHRKNTKLRIDRSHINQQMSPSQAQQSDEDEDEDFDESNSAVPFALEAAMDQSEPQPSTSGLNSRPLVGTMYRSRKRQRTIDDFEPEEEPPLFADARSQYSEAGELLKHVATMVANWNTKMSSSRHAFCHFIAAECEKISENLWGQYVLQVAEITNNFVTKSSAADTTPPATKKK